MFKKTRLTRPNIIFLSIAGLILAGGAALAIYIMANSRPTEIIPEQPTFEPPTATLSATATLLPNQTPTPATSTSVVTITNIPTGAFTPTNQIFNILQWPTSRTVVRTATPQIINVIIPTSTTSMQVPTTAVPTITTAENCYNILYPVKPGQVWNYGVTANSRSGDVRMSILSVQGSSGTVEVFNQSRGVTGQGNIQCQGDIILNFPSISTDALLGNALDGNMKVDFVSGVLAPNEAAFKNTNWALSWSSQYLVSGDSTITFQGSTFNVVLNPSSITMVCQTVASGEAAFETVTVPAGTFKALKVVCIGQGQGTGTVNGSSISGWISAQSTQWFLPYTGLVKMQSDFANFEVFGITIPLGGSGVSGRIELKSFIQGP